MNPWPMPQRAPAVSTPVAVVTSPSTNKPENRGSAMALYTGLFDVAAFVGAPALGAVIQAAGYDVMWPTAAAVVALGVVVFARMDRRMAVATA